MMMLSFAIIGCNSNIEQGTSNTVGQDGDSKTTKNAKEISPEKITFITADYCTGRSEVYVLTTGKIDYYDVSSCWRDGISWLDAEPWMYQSSWKQYTLEDEEWESIVSILNDKGFSGLPEDLSVDDVMDGGATTIEVLTDSERFLSGGSNVQGGKDEDRKNFVEIESVIYGVLKEACVSEKRTDEYKEKVNKEINLLDTIPLVVFFEKSGVFGDDFESATDTYVLYAMGEKFDRTDEDIINGVNDTRMSVEELTEFYNEVLGYDRTFTPQEEWAEGERTFCSQEGYVYALWDPDLIRLYYASTSHYSEPGADGMEMESTIFYHEPGKDELDPYMDCRFTLEYADNSYGYKLTSFEMTPCDDQ